MGITEISDLNASELQIYKETSEVQLLRINEPEPGIFIAESPRVIERALDAGYKPISMLIEKRLLPMYDRHGILEKENTDPEKNSFKSYKEYSDTTSDNSDTDPISETQAVVDRCIKEYDIPVYLADDSVLVQITGFHLTRGVLCAMKRRELPTVSEICKDTRRIAVLENVTNPTNVGAIVRSAAALGMEAVLFTDGCSDPLYRRAIRVSMGTVFQVPWTFLPKGREIDVLKELGFKTVALALRNDTKDIDDKELHEAEKLAIFLGAEGDGLLPETISACDYCVKIPMAHGVDSLNVAACSAVAFWELSRGLG